MPESAIKWCKGHEIERTTAQAVSTQEEIVIILTRSPQIVLRDQVLIVKSTVEKNFQPVDSRILLKNLISGRSRQNPPMPGTSKRKDVDLNR